MNTGDNSDIDMDLLSKIQANKAKLEKQEMASASNEVKEQVPVDTPVPVPAGALQTQDKSDQLLTDVTSLWNIPSGAIQEMKVHASKIKMTHGMLAAVPLLCKDIDCPYKDVCTISPQHRVVGQRCPMEAAALITRFQQYCEHFDLSMSTPTPEELIDMSLVNDLVEVEVQMMRASNRIAINGDFISRTIGSVDHKGKVYYEDAIDPAAEYNDRLKEKRWKIYRLLDSTRKDKASKGIMGDNPSVKAASLFEKIRSAMDDNQIAVDVPYEVVAEAQDVQETPVLENKDDKSEV